MRRFVLAAGSIRARFDGGIVRPLEQGVSLFEIGYRTISGSGELLSSSKSITSGLFAAAMAP